MNTPSCIRLAARIAALVPAVSAAAANCVFTEHTKEAAGRGRREVAAFAIAVWTVQTVRSDGDGN